MGARRCDMTPSRVVNYQRTLKNPSAPRVIPRAGKAVSVGRISMTNTGRTSRGRSRSYLDFIPADKWTRVYCRLTVVTYTCTCVDVRPPRPDTNIFRVHRKRFLRICRCGRRPPSILLFAFVALLVRAERENVPEAKVKSC